MRHAEQPLIPEAANRERCGLLGCRVEEPNVERADRAEIPDIGEIRTFADVQRVDDFRHQEVEVGVTLAVCMGAHVDRHVVDRDRKIGAVIEIVAAQEILVGFAFATVLRHDQSGHGLENFPRARGRTRVQFVATHRHLARHARGTRGT